MEETTQDYEDRYDEYMELEQDKAEEAENSYWENIYYED